MPQNGHDAYLESRILSADPIELVRLLYQACTNEVRNARRHLEGGRILERARSITKASEALLELAASLDHQRGGEISGQLERLYHYMLRRLTDANVQQSDAPLAEVLSLLATLGEAWDGVQQAVRSAAPAPVQSPWADTASAAMPQMQETVSESRAWSF